jgi:hypothetical protein
VTMVHERTSTMVAYMSPCCVGETKHCSAQMCGVAEEPPAKDQPKRVNADKRTQNLWSQRLRHASTGFTWTIANHRGIQVEERQENNLQLMQQEMSTMAQMVCKHSTLASGRCTTNMERRA